MIYIFIALLLVLVVYLIIRLIKIQNGIYDEVNRKIKNKLKEYEDIKQKTTQAITEEERANQELEKRKEQIANAIQTVEELTKNSKKLADEKMRVELDVLRQERLQKIQQEIAQAEENATKTKKELNEIIDNLRIELADYEAKRTAIIAAQKRELELQNQKDFHSIILDNNTIEDIAFIKEILTKVHKKEIIAKVIWESYLQVPTKEMLNRVVGKEKISGIYRITNIKNQQCYVGQGVDISNRLIQHIKGTLGIQSIADQRIHHIMADEGLENWTFEILERCNKEKLNEREKYWINFYKSDEFGYNKTAGGAAKR